MTRYRIRQARPHACDPMPCAPSDRYPESRLRVGMQPHRSTWRHRPPGSFAPRIHFGVPERAVDHRLGRRTISPWRSRHGPSGFVCRRSRSASAGSAPQPRRISSSPSRSNRGSIRPRAIWVDHLVTVAAACSSRRVLIQRRPRRVLRSKQGGIPSRPGLAYI